VKMKDIPKFPDPKERAKIMARRNQLHRDLIEYMVMRTTDDQELQDQMDPLVREYGFPEVDRMMRKLSMGLHRPSDPDEDERHLYAEYVGLYGRFGGERQFLSQSEYLRLNHERAMLLAREILQELQLSQSEQSRVDELSDLLLSEPFLWDDLVPENPPRMLAKEHGAMPSRKVGRNEPCPCGSGRKYKHCHGR
jgi:hypothetical protein